MKFKHFAGLFNLGKSKTDLDWNLSITQISENAFHQSDLPCLNSLLLDAEITKGGNKCYWLQEYLKCDSYIIKYFAAIFSLIMFGIFTKISETFWKAILKLVRFFIPFLPSFLPSLPPPCYSFSDHYCVALIHLLLKIKGWRKISKPLEKTAIHLNLQKKK